MCEKDLINKILWMLQRKRKNGFDIKSKNNVFGFRIMNVIDRDVIIFGGYGNDYKIFDIDSLANPEKEIAEAFIDFIKGYDEVLHDCSIKEYTVF